MKKFLVGLLVVVMCFALVGCGKSQTNSNTGTNTNNSSQGIQGDDKKGVGLENVTESNYAQIMKENYGIDPIYGDGWTIKEVKSPNKTNNLRVNYKTPEDIDPKEWTKKYFDATLAVSTDGIYGMSMDMNTGALSKSDKLTSYDDYANGSYWGWYYYWNDREIQFTPSIFAGDALVTFVFVKTN